MTHVQQPMHRLVSHMTASLFSSRNIAPDIQAATHGASSQCRQKMGIFRPSAASTKTRFIAWGVSEGLMKMHFAWECSMAQASSHVLHAVHLSG
jgi:hypothetical protein